MEDAECMYVVEIDRNLILGAHEYQDLYTTDSIRLIGIIPNEEFHDVDENCI